MYARNASRVLAIDEAFDRPSVTLRYCVNTMQPKITKSSLFQVFMDDVRHKVLKLKCFKVTQQKPL